MLLGAGAVRTGAFAVHGVCGEEVGALGAGMGGEGAGILGVACSEGCTGVALMASNCGPGLNECIKLCIATYPGEPWASSGSTADAREFRTVTNAPTDAIGCATIID